MMAQLVKVIACFLSVWFLSQAAWAGPYDDGLEAYEAGEYGRAYKILGKAIKKASSKLKRAESLALMGAAAAKLGKKDKAKDLFSKAKDLDPDVELPSAANKDKTVKTLFARGSSGKSSGSFSGSDDDENMGRGPRGRKHERGPDFGRVSNYFPLGINQFMQNKPLLGAAFGGVQAVGALLYLDRQKAITTANKDATEAFAEYNALSAPTADDTDKLLTFFNANEAFVKSAQRDAQLSLLLVLAGYGFSVYEAIYSPFSASPSRGKHRADLESEPNEQGDWVLEDRQLLSNPEVPTVIYNVSLLPSPDPYLLFSLKRKF